MSDNGIPATMRVPRFLGKGEIDFIEKPVPEPGPGQLLLQVKANALCGSERPQFFQGSAVTPGHEAAGVVVAAGPNTQTALGTPGVVFLMDFCGECRSCRLGMTNQCLRKRGDMGFNKDGGYGVYELINENIFFPIDPDISFTDATVLLDIMGTNGHGIRRAKLVHPDIQSLLVAGAGPIGLGMLAMAKITWGHDFPVAIFDIVPWRLKLAEQLGGLPIDLSQQTLAEGLRTHDLPAIDVAVDTSGKGAARQACLNALAQRGVLVCIGHGEGLTVTVSPDLIATERAVLGSEYFCYNELSANLELLRKHRPYLNQIITHCLGVSDIQKAFELFFAGDTGKVIIEQ
ncbi:MAG: alcohol dehydrogenase catalytic domain-containing protein [Anaerolineales bacterium]|nr:alcohol dehydrogenase catalytic domain-containing protein [Anaerolineales bacterium]